MKRHLTKILHKLIWVATKSNRGSSFEDDVLLNSPMLALVSLAIVTVLIAGFVSLGATYLSLQADTETLDRWLGPEERQFKSIFMDEATDSVDLNRKLAEAEAKFEALADSSFHLVVDTSKEKLYLMYENKVLRPVEVSIPAGTRVLSQTVKLSSFSFPVGKLQIINKAAEYKWHQPWWYQVDNGTSIKDVGTFNESTSEYVLHFGNGYMIYSTPVPKIPDEAVRYGSLEISEADMQSIYQAIEPGSRILVF